MQYASIIASLPMLRFGEKPPVTLDEFRANCALLSEPDAAELDRFLAGQTGEISAPFLLAWLNADTQIRCAVARLRSEANNTDAAPHLRPFAGYDVLTQKTVEDAMAARDPLERERMIDRRRWSILDELSLDNAYGLDGVLAYAAKLQIAWRWASLDDARAAQVIESLTVENLKQEGSMVRFLNEDQAAS